MNKRSCKIYILSKLNLPICYYVRFFGLFSRIISKYDLQYREKAILTNKKRVNYTLHIFQNTFLCCEGIALFNNIVEF